MFYQKSIKLPKDAYKHTAFPRQMPNFAVDINVSLSQ